MRNLLHRSLSVLLVCITLCSFSPSITFASVDAPAPEETDPSAEATPETEESIPQEDSRSDEVIEISIDL